MSAHQYSKHKKEENQTNNLCVLMLDLLSSKSQTFYSETRIKDITIAQN